MPLSTPSSSSAELDFPSIRAAGSAELGLPKGQELQDAVAAAHELLQEALAAVARRIAERQAQLAALQQELDLPAESHLLQCVLGLAGGGEQGTARQESCKALSCSSSRQPSLQLRAEAGQRSLHYADSRRSVPVVLASQRPGAAAAGMPGRPAARLVRLLRGARQCFGRGAPRGEASQSPGAAGTTAPAAAAAAAAAPAAAAIEMGAAEAQLGQGAAAGGSGPVADAADCTAVNEIGAPMPALPAAPSQLSPAPSPAPADTASTARIRALAADSSQPPTAAFSPTLVGADTTAQLRCELEKLREQMALLQQEKEQAAVLEHVQRQLLQEKVDRLLAENEQAVAMAEEQMQRAQRAQQAEARALQELTAMRRQLELEAARAAGLEEALAEARRWMGLPSTASELLPQPSSSWAAPTSGLAAGPLSSAASRHSSCGAFTAQHAPRPEAPLQQLSQLSPSGQS